MKLPFEILHIHKGNTLTAHQVIGEHYYLWIVTLSSSGDTSIVTSNPNLNTAQPATRYPEFQTAYTEYYQRITRFLAKGDSTP